MVAALQINKENEEKKYASAKKKKKFHILALSLSPIPFTEEEPRAEAS